MIALVGTLTSILHAAPISDADREFFESRIRPILAQECYECHSEATKSKGGLLLDSRPGWMKGGDSGAVIVPGDPAGSLVLQSIRHEVEDLKMPKAGAKLEDSILEDFRQWIERGAPDPRDQPPSAQELESDTDWRAISARRAQWWSFQPIVRPEIPKVAGAPIDAFIRERLASEGLEPAAPADPRFLIRRLSFYLNGLPPTPAQTASFLAAWKDDPDKATAALVDRLLGDPAFGETWARHWMDWTRYADTHGSEGDPVIPHAWQYRDYLIRALNADVPVDQLMTEHLAGDLLDQPRLDPEGKINESALGLGHWRMVFHGFSPTDALEERVRFTDDQINAVTKSFLGLTVSCARCHDHKFDAISQEDYYALYGIFTTPLPATIAVDAPGVLEVHREELASLKKEIRPLLAEAWRQSVPRAIREGKRGKNAGGEGVASFINGLIAAPDIAAAKKVWEDARKRLADYRNARERFEKSSTRRDDLSRDEDLERWSRIGEGRSEGPTAAGDFLMATEGAAPVAHILPGGAYSSTLSTRHRGVLASEPIGLDRENDLYVRVAGEEVQARYSVQHYPRTGTVYPLTNLGDGDWRWVKYDLGYWKGDQLHFEITTAGDAPVNVKDSDRSWFGVGEAVLVPKGASGPPEIGTGALAVLLDAKSENPPSKTESLAAVADGLDRLIERWGKAEKLSDDEALTLEQLLQAGYLAEHPDKPAKDLAALVERYRKLEAEIPLPTRAPGIWERPGADQALYVRGNHKQPAQKVPRRFPRGHRRDSLRDHRHRASRTRPRLRFGPESLHGPRVRQPDLDPSFRRRHRCFGR